jgi:hypothetical protein
MAETKTIQKKKVFIVLITKSAFAPGEASWCEDLSRTLPVVCSTFGGPRNLLDPAALAAMLVGDQVLWRGFLITVESLVESGLK